MSDTTACRVGVDLGGTGTRAISVVNGAVVAAKDVSTEVLGAGTVSERVSRLAGLIRDVVPDGTQLAAVGIGASGPVDVAAGVIHNSATLPWFTGFDIVDQLRAALDVPVGIDNDAVAAAFGEFSTGAGVGVDRLLVVTLGTGVGVSMLVDGQPLRGLNAAHPEGGPIPIRSDSYRCYCGLTGCWEQHASRTALQRALSVAMDGAETSRELIPNAMRIAETDDRVRQAFSAYGAAVGRGLASLHTVYQPRVTIIGGSAAVCFPLIEKYIVATLSRSHDFHVETELRTAQLGDTAGAIGAAFQIAGSVSGVPETTLTGDIA